MHLHSVNEDHYIAASKETQEASSCNIQLNGGALTAECYEY